MENKKDPFTVQNQYNGWLWPVFPGLFRFQHPEGDDCYAQYDIPWYFEFLQTMKNANL